MGISIYNLILILGLKFEVWNEDKIFDYFVINRDKMPREDFDKYTAKSIVILKWYITRKYFEGIKTTKTDYLFFRIKDSSVCTEWTH